MSKPIAKKGSAYWHYDFVIKGARFHGSTGLTSKRAAKELIEQIRQDILIGKPAQPQITLDEACGLYRDHAEHLPSWPTARYMLQALVDGLPKDQFLSKMTQRDLIAYIARRRKDRSNSSVNRELDTMSAIWHRAQAAECDIGTMPNWKALRLKQPRRTHRILAHAEQPELVEAVRSDVRGAVEFLLLSGWRRAEVIGLRWSDIDLAAMTAVTRIKGGDYVTRPLTGSMVTLIANQPKAGPFVFTYECRLDCSRTRRKGHRYPLTVTVLRKAWKDAQAASDGLSSPIRIHDLRHTLATRMLRETDNIYLVKEALKHRSINTTLQYVHARDQDVRSGLEASESRTIPEVPKSKRA